MNKKIYRKLNEIKMNNFVNDIGELNMAELSSYISAELEFEPNSVEDERCFEIIANLTNKDL